MVLDWMEDTELDMGPLPNFRGTHVIITKVIPHNKLKYTTTSQ